MHLDISLPVQGHLVIHELQNFQIMECLLGNDQGSNQKLVSLSLNPHSCFFYLWSHSNILSIMRCNMFRRGPQSKKSWWSLGNLMQESIVFAYFTLKLASSVVFMLLVLVSQVLPLYSTHIFY